MKRYISFCLLITVVALTCTMLTSAKFEPVSDCEYTGLDNISCQMTSDSETESNEMPDSLTSDNMAEKGSSTESLLDTVDFNLTSDSEMAILKWDDICNAEGYNIYYKTLLSDEWILYSSTESTDITIKDLDGGRRYYFSIRAYCTKNSKLYESRYIIRSIVVDYNYCIYSAINDADIYNKDKKACGSIEKDSLYTGYYDYTYDGYIVINYMSTEVLVKSEYVSANENAVILPTGTIGQYGGSIKGYSACGPTAVVILLNSEKHTNWNKDSLILFSEFNNLNDQGSLRKGGGMTDAMLIKLIKMYSGGNYSASNIYDSNSTELLKEQIDNGHRAIVVLQYSGGIVTHYSSKTHFVVICGYEYINNELFFYYADPYYGDGGDSIKIAPAALISESMGMVVKEPKTLIVLN